MGSVLASGELGAMASKFKLLVLERANLDKAQLEQLLKGYLPGLHRERAHDILVDGATLPASIAESDKEGDVRRVKASLEKVGFAVCVVEDTSLSASFERTAETGRRIVGFFPDLIRGIGEVFTRRPGARSDAAERGERGGWVPEWMPTHLRGIWVVALPVMALVAIGGVWLLFTVQIENSGGGSDLTFPEWTGVSSKVVEPGAIKAVFAFAFGTLLGWTLVPFLGTRKAGKKRGFLLILGILGGVFAVILLATLAPWRYMTGGAQDGGGELGAGGGGGGDMRPNASGSELDLSAPETTQGPSASQEADGSFAGFVHGLQGPESPCDPDLSPFAGLLCELRAMGPPPEGFSPDDPDALADMLTSSFEAAADDDSAGDDDDSSEGGDGDSAGDGVAGGPGGVSEDERSEAGEPEPERDAGADSAPQENSLAAPGGAGGQASPGRRGGGGGGSPDESELEQLDEEDRIGADEPMDSPTRNIFRGEAPGQDTSIPQGYTREGMRSRPDDERAAGTLSDETTESPMRDQAMGPVSLLVGLVLGGGLGVLRRWRRKR